MFELKEIHGTAKYSFLSAPDEGFGASKYHVVLTVAKPAAEEHIKTIKKMVMNEKVEAGKLNPNQTRKYTEAPLPYVDNGDTVDFKIHSKFKPKAYDIKGKPLEEEEQIWKDSTMWVKYKAQGYNKSMGLGCTLYIQQIQIDNLVTGGVDQSPFPDRTKEKAQDQVEQVEAFELLKKEAA